MAKLNVTVPAVDVEVNGVKYRKIDRDAQVGDIIRYMDDSDYVTKGAFYAVTRIDGADDPHISDDDGDDHDLCGEEFEVYAKVSETAEYREVKRWAEPGERIRIVRKYSGEERYENGAEFVVDSVDGDGDVRVTVKSWGRVTVMLCEYAVLEPICVRELATKRLTVGDYAKITGERHGHQFKIGEIVKIVKDDESEHLPYKGETANGRDRIAVWFGPGEYEPATEAEFLAQKRLKVGEFAKVVAKNRMFTEERVSVSDVVKITEDDDSSRPFHTETIDGKNAGWFTESELVRATDDEVTEAKRKLAATDLRSQFTKGEKVRLISGGGKYPLNGYDNGGIYEVDTSLYETHPDGPVVKIVGGDIPYGYAKPEQLAKLTIEVGSTVRLTIKDGEGPAYGWGGVNNGAIGTVTRINGNSARVEFPAQSRWHALLSELTLVTDGEKPQPQPEPVRFRVGEYARTLVDKEGIPTGSIVKVVRDDEDSNPFRSVLLDGSAYHYYTQEELERLDAETAKWAMIGREVGEFKDGDVVQVVDDSCLEVEGAIKNGDIVTLEYAGAGMFRLQKKGVDGGNYASPHRFKLVTPVEQRFDRKGLEATEAAA
ncbi:hypothetical protein KSP24_02895 [Paenibacillus sp. AK121]|uniref:hypothetical protein n=1 Tax=Paenibacillus sp. AK121 TaxID=2849670 RepID=UPI001C212560|nr:hypothetical protein [Paenibacillus sp. AK121]MBU9705872.1 hypothetical protein [Paenibacillus sp. AK121]